MTTDTITLDTIGKKIRAGAMGEAETALKAITETPENKSERLFLQGLLHEHQFDRAAACACYESVINQDPDHIEAAFRAALLGDQYGDAETALSLLERCTDQEQVSANLLLNLSVLYEDHGAFEKAEACIRDVLNAHPNHRRARQFQKSVQSSYTMVYDEQSQKERERRDAVLDQPISDFELSVRSRNCLRQMDLCTIGDLLRTTEAELLSYKNFGETSLQEIKALLDQKGLRLGQALRMPERPVVEAPPPALTGDAAVHADRPVSDLELSVRSRKCLMRLGINTMGELAMRTEAELISSKNFGQTSLSEIKQQLDRFGLSLRV